MSSSKGSVKKNDKGFWCYDVRVDGKRIKRQGFKTKKEATEGLEVARSKAKTPKRQNPNKFWDAKKLLHMRDQILPNSRTINEALRKATDKWNRKTDRAHFTTTFAEHFGHSPKQYIGIKAGPIDNPFPDLPPNLNPVILLQRTKELEKEIERLTTKAAESTKLGDALKEVIWGVKDTKFTIPEFTYVPPKTSGTFHGAPTLDCGDWHFTEMIDSKHVIGDKDYNCAIAERRIERITTKTCDFISGRVLSESQIPGMVLIYGGDMFPGYIHDDLRANLEMPVGPAMFELKRIAIKQIDTLKKVAGKVYVICTAGNHARMDKKPRSKNAVYDNYEWIWYQMLAEHYCHPDHNDPDVEFLVPDAFEARYKLYGTRMLVIHGFEFKGGGGVTGPLLPWARGYQKKQQQSQSATLWTEQDLNFDVMVIHHWHQYFPGRNFIVNGALVETNEYATISQFPYEPACQALWFTHPETGITIQAPIYADKIDRFSASSGNWVSVFEQDKDKS